jgi:glycosyltransferase involved in cell wall biosynthesis
MNTLTTHSHPVTARRNPAARKIPTAEHLDPMRPSRLPPFPQPHPAVEIVIPVYNEQRALRQSVHALYAYMSTRFAFPFQLTIADNASTDATLKRATELASELRDVRVLHLERKGRGRALRSAWSSSRADVLAYMDVDLSTDLSALPELLAPLLEGRGDIAIGSRLAPGAHVTRGLKRELISRGYNLLLHALLRVGFSDAQCGFKAGRQEVIRALLDDVHDDDWFFDTELLYQAQRHRFAIHEVPVRWVDDPDSRVDIIATARADLAGIRRLRRDATAEPELDENLTPTVNAKRRTEPGRNDLTLRQALARPSSSSHQKWQLPSSPSRSGMESPAYRSTYVYRCRRRAGKRVCLSQLAPSDYSRACGWGALGRASCGCRT